MEEQAKLTDQVIAEEKKEEQQKIDNLEIAEKMLEQLVPAFNEALERLSRKETKRLMLLLVQFPFIDVKKFKLNQKQRIAFMYGERLVYANMVKRARAELDRTFGEVQKEMDQKINDNVSVNESGGLTIGTPGNEEQTHVIKGNQNAESTPTVE